MADADATTLVKGKRVSSWAPANQLSISAAIAWRTTACHGRALVLWCTVVRPNP
jgi:hypothetical protein